MRAEIERLTAKGIRSPLPAPWRDSDTYENAVEVLLLFREHLSTWECGFLASLLSRRPRYTPKQIDVLEEIGRKVDRCIRSAWGAS